MFRKYEKTYHMDASGKFCLSKSDISDLLNGEVIVEEKMDGANVGIIRHKNGFHLQKRGSLVGQSEHEQFGFFHNWANYQNFDKIMNLPKGYTVYGELLFAVHTCYYDQLPDYFLAFDVWDGSRYLKYDQRSEFCEEFDFNMVPLLNRGHFTKEELLNMIPEKSAYGGFAEGIVAKRYTKKEYHRAKIVKPEFRKILDESDHWMKYSIRRNKLKDQS